MYVKVSAVKPPLTRPWAGPYQVISRWDKVLTIKKPDGSTDEVSLDRVKPAYFDCQVLSSEPPPPSVPTSRSGRPINKPKRYANRACNLDTTPLAFAAFRPTSTERFRLQTCAFHPIPLLEDPVFTDSSGDEYADLRQPSQHPTAP